MQKAVEAAIDTMSRSFYKHSLCSEGKEAVQALAKAAGVSIDKFTGTPVTMEMETPEFVVPGASDENGIDQDDFDTEGSITLIHRKSKKRFVFKADDLLYGIRQ